MMALFSGRLSSRPWVARMAPAFERSQSVAFVWSRTKLRVLGVAFASWSRVLMSSLGSPWRVPLTASEICSVVNCVMVKPYWFCRL